MSAILYRLYRTVARASNLWDDRSSHFPVFLQERNHISDSPGIDGGGIELVSELDKIALSLALISSSCLISCSSAYRCTFRSTVGLQLSVYNSLRQSGLP